MSHFEEWRPIRIRHVGEQPRTARHLNYLPAWDVTAICREPDGEVPRNEPAFRDEHRSHWPPELEKKIRFEDVRQYVYWNRHIDRRFYIEYPHALRDYPRDQGAAITDPDREWDTFIATRDRWLAEAGLKPAPAREVVRRLAELWLCENFEKRPAFAKFEQEPRQLNHPLDALLHKTWCVGASQTFVALADSLGLPARGIGSQGHRTAEVFVEGKWRYVENTMRRPETAAALRGNDCFFDASYMELVLDPWGDPAGAGARLVENYRASLWWRVSGWYHFVFGTWTSPHAMLFTAQNMAAIYPGERRYGIKTFNPHRLPIINRSCSGFCWPSVHGYGRVDFPCHRLAPGERLRESIWLDATDDIEEIEVLLTFDASRRESDFSESEGEGLIIQVGSFRKSLRELGAWPPRPAKEVTEYPFHARRPCVIAKLPAEVFTPNGLTWLELVHEGKYPSFVPCVPAVMEPYIAPLWSESEDAYGPPLPPSAKWELWRLE